jgi:hypothetical protein
MDCGSGRPSGLPAEYGRRHGEWLLRSSGPHFFIHRIKGVSIPRGEGCPSRAGSEFELELELDDAEVRGVLSGYSQEP